MEQLLEGILAGLRARKEIEPLRKENSDLKEKISTAEENFKKLSAEKNSLEKNLDDLKIERGKLNSQLENIRADYEKKISELQQKFSAELAEKEKILSDLQKKCSAAESEAKFYRESFSELDEIYKIYLTLNDNTKFDLAGVFGEGKTVAGFFSGAVQESHIAPFWDYVSSHFDDENFEKLCRIFDFCFEMFNKGFREPPFVRLTVAEGNFFDDEIMRRTPHSPQMGNVTRIFLQGYKYRVGNVVKPSVVEIQ